MSKGSGSPNEKMDAEAEKAEVMLRINVRRPDSTLKPSQCRSWLRNAVAEALPELLEGFLNEAVKGGSTQMKMVLDTVAAPPAARKDKIVKGPAETLLERLDRECPE